MNSRALVVHCQDDKQTLIQFTNSNGDLTTKECFSSPYYVFNSPFMEPASLAYTEFQPLKITPEDIHLLLLQGVQNFLRIYAKDFDYLLNKASIAQFEDIKLQAYSETKELQRQVKIHSLRENFSKYFNCNLTTRIMVPEFILTGTEADWHNLMLLPIRIIRLLNLQKKPEDCEPKGTHLLFLWFERLMPLLHEFANARKGEPDADFWWHFYREDNDSEVIDCVTGKIILLYPFLQVLDAKQCALMGEFVLNPWIMHPQEMTLGREKNYGPLVNELPVNNLEMGLRYRELLAKQIEMQLDQNKVTAEKMQLLEEEKALKCSDLERALSEKIRLIEVERSSQAEVAAQKLELAKLHAEIERLQQRKIIEEKSLRDHPNAERIQATAIHIRTLGFWGSKTPVAIPGVALEEDNAQKSYWSYLKGCTIV